MEANRPLSMDEIFPLNGLIMGKQLTSSRLKGLLEGLVKKGTIKEHGIGNKTRYNYAQQGQVRKYDPIVYGCPPTTVDDLVTVAMHHPMIKNRCQGKDPLYSEIQARVKIAARALERLAASGADTAEKSLLRQNLFIANRGDKYQLKQIINEAWQCDFLSRLEKDGIINVIIDDNIKCYHIADMSFVNDLILSKGNICIYTMLWPEDPCDMDHDAARIKMGIDKFVDKSITEGLSSEEILKKFKTKLDVASAARPALPKDNPTKDNGEKSSDQEIVDNNVEPGQDPVHINQEHQELMNLNENLNEAFKVGVMELIFKQSKVITANFDFIKSSLKLLEEENNHLHKKLDILHNENLSIMEKIEKPKSDEPILGSIKKKLSEIEKMVDTNNKSVKAGIAETAAAIVTAASKNENTDTSKALSDIFSSIEKIRMDIKNDRTQAIMDRTGVISVEIKKLGSILAGIK